MLWLDLQHLKSKNAETRLQAVKQLAESGRSRAFEALAEACQDEEAQVRAAAVTAIGKMEDERVVGVLIDALKDRYPEVRRGAIDALRKQADKRALAALVSSLKDFDPGVRGRAARGLEQQGWHPHNEQEEIWYAVAQGRLTRAASYGPAAIDALEIVLNGGPYNLQITAIEALGSIPDERVLKLLLPALKSPDHAMCLAAVATLSNVGGPKVVNSLIPMLQHSDHRVRVAVIEALAQLDAQQVAGSLVTLLRDSMWDVRCAAALALSKVSNPEAVDGLASVIADPDSDVREAAVTSLGRLCDPRAIGALVLGLKDAEASVRRAAASALQQINPRWAQTEAARQMAGELRAAVASNDQAVHYAALNVLARIGESAKPPTVEFDTTLLTVADKRRRRARAIFEQLLQDVDRDVRLASAESLGRLGDRQAVSALMSALSDADNSVRRTAAVALQEFGVA